MGELHCWRRDRDRRDGAAARRGRRKPAASSASPPSAPTARNPCFLPFGRVIAKYQTELQILFRYIDSTLEFDRYLAHGHAFNRQSAETQGGSQQPVLCDHACPWARRA